MIYLSRVGSQYLNVFVGKGHSFDPRRALIPRFDSYCSKHLLPRAFAGAVLVGAPMEPPWDGLAEPSWLEILGSRSWSSVRLASVSPN